MKILLAVVLLIVVAGPLIWGAAFWRYRAQISQSDAAFAAVLGQATANPPLFEPSMLDGLPDVARRYFAHAIAPGTPLSTTVKLQMSGTLTLGDASGPRPFAMTARQALNAPTDFVWQPQMRAGPMLIAGSDGLTDHAWTRFWLLWSVPVVRTEVSADLDRSARARPVLEAIWAPAALLPQNGAQWVQTGPLEAQVTVGPDPVTLDMTLAEDGRLLSIVTQRWSNENPERTWRLQPFGADMLAEAQFGGFTIPSEVSVGNHYGTPDYFAFFEARITSAVWH